MTSVVLKRRCNFFVGVKMKILVFIAILLGCIHLTQGGCQTHCYFRASRTGTVSFQPDNIDPSLCEYLIIGYSTIALYGNPRLEIRQQIYKFIQRIPLYKGRNANFKILLEVTDMYDFLITEFFEYLTSDSLINKFATNAKQFLLEKGFDGLSIRLAENFGSTDYRFTFSSFVNIMSSNFQNGAKRLLLYVSLSGTQYLFTDELDFDFGGVGRAVDKLVLETEFFRPPARTHGHPSRLYGDPGKTNISVNFVINLAISRGCPKEKLIFTVSPLSRCFQKTSTHPDAQYLYVYSSRFSEFCQFLAKGIQVQRLSDGGPYVTGRVLENHPMPFTGDFIYYYEDDVSLKAKVDYVKQKGLGGIMLWDFWNDDIMGTCRRGPYPILRAVRSECR
ncbi:chitotriosidase-1, partial [Biomphalaria pfeifferi]